MDSFRSTLLEQRLLEHHRIDRFLKDHALETVQAAAFDDVILIVVERGHHDHGEVRRTFLDGLIKFIAVHVRHDHVA